MIPQNTPRMKTIYLTLLIQLLLFVVFNKGYSQTKKEVSIKSKYLNKTVKAMVYIPEVEEYDKNRKFSTLYILHGYSDTYEKWPMEYRNIEYWCQHLKLIIICPDGFKTWYFDSPVDKSSQYESFFVKEFIPFIDSITPSAKVKDSRAITGLSMGGHGALYLALKNPELFKCAGSMAGLMDLSTSSKDYDLPKLLGPYEQNQELWKKYSVLHMEKEWKKAAKENTFFALDCGWGDKFYQGNEDLHKKLKEWKIEHLWMSSNGIHSWNYWTKSIDFHFLYFKRFLLE